MPQATTRATHNRSYQDCLQVEDAARREILPWLLMQGFRVRDTAGHELLQKTFGDFIVYTNLHKRVSIELKAEAENRHGNFYLETWSNKKWRTPGWMISNCSAEWLFYYFVKESELYVIRFDSLRSWAFDGNRIYAFPERPQSKHDQLNDAWGCCVPIKVIKEEVGFQLYTARDAITPPLVSEEEWKDSISVLQLRKCRTCGKPADFLAKHDLCVGCLVEDLTGSVKA